MDEFSNKIKKLFLTEGNQTLTDVINSAFRNKEAPLSVNDVWGFLKHWPKKPNDDAMEVLYYMLRSARDIEDIGHAMKNANMTKDDLENIVLQAMAGKGPQDFKHEKQLPSVQELAKLLWNEGHDWDPGDIAQIKKSIEEVTNFKAKDIPNEYCIEVDKEMDRLANQTFNKDDGTPLL